MPKALPACPYGVDHVAGRLYMGGLCGPAPWLFDAFDVIVCCAQELQPKKGVYGPLQVILAPLSDTRVPPTGRELSIIRLAGKKVRWALDKGARTLVTCHMGWNRSGVVAALALMLPHGIGDRVWLYSDTPACLKSGKAVEAVRKARGPSALSNPYFEEFLFRSNGVCRNNPSSLRHGAVPF